MNACPAPAAAGPCLGQLLLERDSLECRLARLTGLLRQADDYLESDGANILLGCYNRSVVRDARLGVLQRLHGLRREIAERSGG